jgi:uncharacterized lipoprotein YmbA
MMPRLNRHNALLSVLLTMLFLLSGCGTTPPSRFYLLEAMPADSAAISSAGDRDNLHIGIGPVEFADYLRRAQIVTRKEGAEVSLAETHRWAEPLADNFSRVLAENLSILMATDRVSLHPSRNWSDIDYQVLVNVWQFDADSSGKVTLAASWSLRGNGGSELLMQRKTTYHAGAAAASYGEIVDALSDTVAQLGRDVANAISAAATP